MPAKRLFAQIVGHVRRRGMEPGSRALADVPAEVMDVNVVELNEQEWRVLTELKREFGPEKISENLWQSRADEAGLPLEEFQDRSGFERAQGHRAVLDVFGTCETAGGWAARDTV